MSKAFFEVFPTLELNKQLKDIMEQTQVEKVATTKSKEYLRIYIFSTRLILKQDIFEVEQEIKRQLFANVGLTVKIYEKYALSSQYNPEKFMDIYRDSILLELEGYNHIIHNAFKKAVFSYPDEKTLVMELDDTVLVRGKEDELVRILEKILVERAGFSVAVKTQ